MRPEASGAIKRLEDSGSFEDPHHCQRALHHAGLDIPNKCSV
jgi:hypothetical protein